MIKPRNLDETPLKIDHNQNIALVKVLLMFSHA